MPRYVHPETERLFNEAYGKLRRERDGLQARVEVLEVRLKAAHERADKVEPEWHRLGDRVAELEKDRDEYKAIAEDLQLICLNDVPTAAIELKGAKDQIADLQAQLERANASRLRIQRDSDRESKCERDESEHVCCACARCYQRVEAQLERAKAEARCWENRYAAEVRSHNSSEPRIELVGCPRCGVEFEHECEQLDRATEARADEMTREEQCAHAHAASYIERARRMRTLR
jgi:hypothetical protein